MRPALVGLVILTAMAAGCGGHADRRVPRRGDEDAERKEAARGLPPADRAAFYQVATGIGALRRRASLVALGRPGAGRADAALRAAILRLRRTRPRLGTLVRLRSGALALARRTVASPLRGAAARRTARRALASANRLSASLADLVRRDPRFSALVPD